MHINQEKPYPVTSMFLKFAVLYFITSILFALIENPQTMLLLFTMEFSRNKAVWFWVFFLLLNGNDMRDLEMYLP